LQRTGGYTIVGTTAVQVGFDRRIDAAAVRDIAVRAAALWPPIALAGEPDVWLGFRPGADSPVIERVEGCNLWLAYGHFRNGILLAPVTASRIGDEITSSLETSSLSPSGSR
jgi:glycine/D-amino acid oxidase-like deaminating enzyme